MRKFIVVLAALALLAIAGTSEAQHRSFSSRGFATGYHGYHVNRVFVFGVSSYTPYVPTIEATYVEPAPVTPAPAPAPAYAPVEVPVYQIQYRYVRDVYGRVFRQAFRVRIS